MDRLPPPDLPGWLEDMVPFDRYMVEVERGLRVHVMESGGGKPVVLFHGNPTWGFLYRKVVEELSGESCRLIMPDLVGLGFSDRPSRPDLHTLENHAGWIGGFLDGLGIDEAVAVVQDWGGPIGLLALSRSEVAMSGLVVMNTSILPPRAGLKPTTFHRVFSTKLGELASRYLGIPQRMLGVAQGDRSSISGAVSRGYAFPLTRERGNHAVPALVRMVPDSMSHPTVAGLSEVKEFVERYEGRSAIVWGDRDPVLGRLRSRHERLLPEAKVTATGAGHFLQEEVPGEIAEAIRYVSGDD